MNNTYSPDRCKSHLHNGYVIVVYTFIYIITGTGTYVKRATPILQQTIRESACSIIRYYYLKHNKRQIKQGKETMRQHNACTCCSKPVKSRHLLWNKVAYIVIARRQLTIYSCTHRTRLIIITVSRVKNGPLGA